MDILELNEPTIRVLHARLAAGLPAAADAVNAAVTDGHTIDPPALVLPYIPSIEQQTAFPIVGIYDSRTLFSDDIGTSMTADHQIGVTAFLAEAELEPLAWKLRRYARAIASVALDGRTLAPGAYGTRAERVDWGPTLSDEEGPRTWISWVTVVIGCLSEEG